MNLPDVIAWLNHPIPGEPDPQFTRLVIVFLIMAIAFGATREARTYWRTWARRVKREKQQILGLLVVNGLALIAAAMRDDPIRIITALLGATFAVIAVSLFVRFRNDGSVDPVYPQLYPRAILARLR